MSYQVCKIGWDLRSAVSVPEGGLREFFDRITIRLCNRATGEIHSATAKSHNPWIAICFALKEITGVHVDDQQLSHDSLLLFASAAMIDVNRKLRQEAELEAKAAKDAAELAASAKKMRIKPCTEEKEFPWPLNASIGGEDSRIAGQSREEMQLEAAIAQ